MTALTFEQNRDLEFVNDLLRLYGSCNFYLKLISVHIKEFSVHLNFIYLFVKSCYSYFC